MSFDSANKIGGSFMSKIKNSFNLSWKTGVCILVGLLLIGNIAYYFLLQNSVKNVYNPETITEGYSGSDGKNAELILFYVDWCPHCKTAKPE